jgi:hypothetical protein
MEPIVGVFRSRADAVKAATGLRLRGLSVDRIQLLLPGDRSGLEGLIATDESEQSGVGKAIGGVTGGAMGASAGLGVAAVVASLALPGIGAVTAIGLAAAALFGAGGAVAGVAVGGALEEKSYHGLPKDELYLYEDALAHGRSVLFATPESDEEAEAIRGALAEGNAESLDAARESFWVGIRDAERLHYDAAGPGTHFQDVEGAYRRGYFAGLRGTAAPEGQLRNEAEKVAFRTGFDRGRASSRAEEAVQVR